jgi:hypothetical protein
MNIRNMLEETLQELQEADEGSEEWLELKSVSYGLEMQLQGLKQRLQL